MLFLLVKCIPLRHRLKVRSRDSKGSGDEIIIKTMQLFALIYVEGWLNFSSQRCHPQSTEITNTAADDGDIHQQCAVRENQSISQPRAAWKMLSLHLWLACHSVCFERSDQVCMWILTVQKKEHCVFSRSVSVFTSLCLFWNHFFKNKQLVSDCGSVKFSFINMKVEFQPYYCNVEHMLLQ